MKSITITQTSDGRTQHLSEILPLIPSNTILHKKLTGIGATYNEIKADRNSIIIEPNKPVIFGKCKDPKHKNDNLLGVYEGVYTEDIIDYIENSKDKKLKVLTTPESFPKVKSAFETMEIDIRFECFLLFDECHKIVKDVNYRTDIKLPMDFFFECEQKALVSATPIEFTDPRFGKQKFNTLEIIPDFVTTKELHLYKTNSVVNRMVELIPRLSESSNNIFIFCNSTDTIYALMERVGIMESSAVFCSDKSADKLKHQKGAGFKSAYSVWEKSNMKKFNFMTSRFYNAVDIELDEKPIVVMITDCYNAEFTMIDPFTDAIQIAGRFRNGVSTIYHVSNLNKNLPVRSKDEIKGYLKCTEAVYNQFSTLYKSESDKIRKQAYLDALLCLPFNNYLNTNGTINYFSIDNYLNDEFTCGYYNNWESLYNAYKTCDQFCLIYEPKDYPIGDCERLQIERTSMSIKNKQKIIVSQLEMLGDCSTEMEMQAKRDLAEADPFIVKAYDILGKDMIEHCSYSKKKLKEAMIHKEYADKSTSIEIVKLVQNSFQEGKWYKDGYIKDELKRIFSLCNVNPPKAITSDTIGEYFECIEKRTKKGRGHMLLKCKFIPGDKY